ncbi:MAG: DNA-processing protein DprA [Motilibacteraceae bacterium]
MPETIPEPIRVPLSLPIDAAVRVPGDRWSAPPLPLAVAVPAPTASATPVPATQVGTVGSPVGTPGSGVEFDPGGSAEVERGARAVLARVAEPADVAVCGLVRRLGAAGALAALRSGRPVEGLRPARLAGLRLRLQGLCEETELGRAAGLGQRIVCPGDAEWPTQLDDLDAVGVNGESPALPPLALWVRGVDDLRMVALRSVAVIGTRTSSPYGRGTAQDLGAALCETGWTVVSGAAYGIDACAHQGALSVGGTTVAVLACGVDRPYPPSHKPLLERIAGTGVLVSELPPGTGVHRHRLLARNRLVAALTRGTVVVEAAVRSGTSRTVGHARRLGRPVMAVPGQVTSPSSVGCHTLVRDGAVLVRHAADVVETVGTLADALAARQRTAPRDEVTAEDDRPGDGLSEVQLRVFDALPVRSGVGTARLAHSAGLDLPTVRAAVGFLVGAGLAEPDGSGYRISAAVRQRRRADRGAGPGRSDPAEHRGALP